MQILPKFYHCEKKNNRYHLNCVSNTFKKYQQFISYAKIFEKITFLILIRTRICASGGKKH